MIKGISIENFLSHKKTELEFHKGVNVFIGSSDHGKSAIIKAINFCVNNKPAGDDYRSYWGGETSVDIELEEGVIISRIRGRENLYAVQLKDSTEMQEFKAFGLRVPDEIQEIFNMTELNFQFQTDRHFLLSNTSGEVARFVNKIAKLEKIDKGLKNAITFKNKMNSKLATLEEDEKIIIEDLKEYDGIDVLENKADKLTTVCDAALILEDEIIELNDMVEEWEELDEVISALSFDVGKLNDKYSKLKKLKKEVDILEDDISDLDSSISVYEYAVGTMELCEHWLSFENKIIKLDSLLDSVSDIEEEINDLVVLMGELKECAINFQDAIDEQKRLEYEKEQIMPDVCPLCGQEIKNDRV